MMKKDEKETLVWIYPPTGRRIFAASTRRVSITVAAEVQRPLKKHPLHRGLLVEMNLAGDGTALAQGPHSGVFNPAADKR